MTSLLRYINPGQIHSVPYASGMIMLLTLVFIYCIASCGLVIGFSVSRFTVMMAFAVAVYIASRYTTRKCLLWSLLINLVVWLLAVFFSWNIYDYSWDGITYHQMTVYALADGWNPIWSNSYSENLSLWTLHYAKGMELISASIFKMTGDIESGKAVNILLAVSSFLICLDIAKKLIKNLSNWNAFLFAFIAIGNPVWICQATTFYIDFAMYFYLLLTIVFSMAIYEDIDMRLNYIGLAGVIIFAIGTKFNHFFMEGIAVIAVLGWLVHSGEKKVAWKIFKISAFAAVIGVVIFAFHPYFTNWISHNTPFYPLMGDNAVDIMTDNTPQLYREHNRFVNLFLSVFGPVSFPVFDSRISGFGPIFKILLLVCLICIIFAEVKSKQISVVTYATMCILASCLIFEQSWWARYNPQLWMIVPLAWYALLKLKKNRKRLVAFGVVAILAIPNVMASGLFPMMEGLRLTAYRNAIYGVLQGKTVKAHVGNMWAERLKYYGVTPIIVDEDVIAEKDRVAILHIPYAQYCWLQMKEEDKARVDSLYQSHPICLFREDLRLYKKSVCPYRKIVL